MKRLFITLFIMLTALSLFAGEKIVVNDYDVANLLSSKNVDVTIDEWNYWDATNMRYISGETILLSGDVVRVVKSKSEVFKNRPEYRYYILVHDRLSGQKNLVVMFSPTKIEGLDVGLTIVFETGYYHLTRVLYKGIKVVPLLELAPDGLLGIFSGTQGTIKPLVQGK